MGLCGSISQSQLKLMDIPPPPGWDGHTCKVIAMKALIPFASAATGVNVEESKQALMAAVQRENVGGAGYRLVSVYMPFKHQNGAMEPLESDDAGVNAMCFFQRAPHASEVELESCVHSTAFQPFEQGNPESAVYENLRVAKDNLYPVSGIVAEPHKAYPHVGQHTAHMICQRPKGDAPNMSDKKFMVSTCRSDLERDEFDKFLAGFSTQKMKITSIFRPPNFPEKTDVHFVFESAPRPYHMAHVDLEFRTRTAKVKHDLYADTINRAAEKGWQLAGIFDMLNGTVSKSGNHFTCTIRLVFQAEKSDGKPQAEVVPKIESLASNRTIAPTELMSDNDELDGAAVNVSFEPTTPTPESNVVDGSAVNLSIDEDVAQVQQPRGMSCAVEEESEEMLIEV
mmetsp:Transcript_118106/g.294469  ORF Transcript_118106/g.294469 Transcript_118106/m.294469 type:complete len:397 (+) Transcript_118106:105-1295(+)